MSVQPPADDSELYCQPEDVAEFFDKYDNFTAETNPSRQEVIRRIRAESNWVDSFTGHAFRERRVENEFHNLDGPYRWRSGTPISLSRRDIRTPFDSDKGDKIEVWDGNEYTDFVAEEQYEEGRDGDYWIDSSTGMLHIYRRYVFWERYMELRISYRFGKERVPQIVRDSTARRVAAHFLESQQYRVSTPDNDDAPDAQQVAETWREMAADDLENYEEVRSTGL